MSRDKGARVEREIVNTHIKAGIHAERFDARRGQFPLCGEIKARKELPKWQREALGENDFLVLRENNHEPMYVVPHNVWIRLLKNG